jgi:hypothetical protein
MVTGPSVSSQCPLRSVTGIRTDILVGKLVRESHTLRLMLARFPVNDSVLEVVHDGLVNRITL